VYIGEMGIFHKNCFEKQVSPGKNLEKVFGKQNGTKFNLWFSKMRYFLKTENSN
jgi:hypothetical protein